MSRTGNLSTQKEVTRATEKQKRAKIPNGHSSEGLRDYRDAKDTESDHPKHIIRIFSIP
jgi:hypothetical protein